ncbi:MAG: hypothetical protein GXP42_08405, partial [Chloroflexi bacterium]|nr:hypothetical protein [Chloroflexota bacterium]
MALVAILWLWSGFALASPMSDTGLMAEPTAAFSRQRAVAGGAGAGLRESPGG